jgi:hypothetical protein
LLSQYAILTTGFGPFGKTVPHLRQILELAHGLRIHERRVLAELQQVLQLAAKLGSSPQHIKLLFQLQDLGIHQRSSIVSTRF